MELERLFLDISVIIVLATVLGLMARWLKQPLILGYVVAGILLGPTVFGFIAEPDVISVLSSFGIAFLLFLVGIELDLSKLKVIGRTSLVLGIGQVAFTAIIGYIIVRLFGVSSLPAAYVAIALTFSSTIIVVKLLSEQKAIESLYGRIAIGMLLVQDFVAIFALVLLSGFTSGANPSVAELTFILLKGAGLIMLALVSGRYLLPKLFLKFANSSEILLLASIAWCFVFSLIASIGGFSLEIGAFLAGLALARLPYHLEIVGRVRSLRDFFITIFFVVLGSQLIFSAASSLIWPFIILSLFVLIGNPLIVMIILKSMGYTKRTGFMVGLTVAQISEFSLILMALGYKLGHVSTAEVSLVTLIGITTITLSSYLISYGDKLYGLLSPYLNFFEKPHAKEKEEPNNSMSDHIIIFGCDRLGERLVRAIQELKLPLLVIDFDPVAVARLKKQNIPCLYGDMADPDIYNEAHMDKARLIISTVPDIADNQLLLQDAKKRGVSCAIYVTADTWHETQTLYNSGADYVVFPHYLTGEHLSEMLSDLALNPANVANLRNKHQADIKLHYASRLK